MPPGEVVPIEYEWFARLWEPAADRRSRHVWTTLQALTPPLPKIFVYDLPAKFNREMVKKYKVRARSV